MARRGRPRTRLRDKAPVLEQTATMEKQGESITDAISIASSSSSDATTFLDPEQQHLNQHPDAKKSEPPALLFAASKPTTGLDSAAAPNSFSSFMDQSTIQSIFKLPPKQEFVAVNTRELPRRFVSKVPDNRPFEPSDWSFTGSKPATELNSAIAPYPFAPSKDLHSEVARNPFATSRDQSIIESSFKSAQKKEQPVAVQTKELTDPSIDKIPNSNLFFVDVKPTPPPQVLEKPKNRTVFSQEAIQARQQTMPAKPPSFNFPTKITPPPVVQPPSRKQTCLMETDISPSGSSEEYDKSREASPSSDRCFNSEEEKKQQLSFHMKLLKTGAQEQDRQQVTTTPIFSHAILEATDQLSQYGFLAGDASLLEKTIDTSGEPDAVLEDPRLYFNIDPPSSAFICGSQGSGKSHTLSCLLENCLMKSSVNKLNNPLGAVVFHYDSFISDLKGDPCEAAYLSSDPRIKVRVLCSPTNIQTIKRTYAGMNIKVEALQIDQSNLNTKRMLDLMAVSPENGPMPLYLHSINRILREMRIEQQAVGGSFNYGKFKRLVDAEDMTPAQLSPLSQRLDTLESFMHPSQASAIRGGSNARRAGPGGNNWTIEAGSLTIVDLSCPCVTPEAACALFNICLAIFLEQETKIGRIIALDEAHKYMNTSAEASTLTHTLLSAIRLQRHLGARIFISTQEPTVSPALLDLCSITIVHRFSSPEWLKCLRLHIAALDNTDGNQKLEIKKVFDKIVKLRVGEALLFAPSALVKVSKETDEEEKLMKLGTGYLRIRVRNRVTQDGGKSVMAR